MQTILQGKNFHFKFFVFTPFQTSSFYSAKDRTPKIYFSV